MRKLTWLLLLAGAALRMVFHLLDRPIVWDASVYVGMAKAIASIGSQGLWEPLRPVIWPLILSPFHWLGMDLLVVANLLQFAMGIGVMFLVFRLTQDSFGELAADWALAFVALSPLLVFYEHQLLTEQPAVFFALLAVFFLRKRPVFAGMFAGLSFLTKFPMGLVFFAIVCVTLTDRRFAKTVLVGAGFSIPVICFLGFNVVLYGNPFASIIAANDVIKTSGLWLYQRGVIFYPLALLFENLFFAFAIPGLVLAFKKNRAVLFVALAIFGYLLLLPHKEVRFLPLVLPFICILAGAGWSLLHRAHASRFKHSFMLVTLLLLAVWGVQALRSGTYYETYEGVRDSGIESMYARQSVGDEIVTSDPRMALFTDKKLIPLYYPLFPQNLSLGLAALGGQTVLLFNPCDTPCAPDDASCQSNLRLFEEIVENSWQHDETLYRGDCRIRRFTLS